MYDMNDVHVCMSIFVKKDVKVKVCLFCRERSNVVITNVRPCALKNAIKEPIRYLMQMRNRLNGAQQNLFMLVALSFHHAGVNLKVEGLKGEERQIRKLRNEFDERVHNKRDDFAATAFLMEHVLCTFAERAIISQENCPETSKPSRRNERVQSQLEENMKDATRYMVKRNKVGEIFRFLRSVGLKNVVRDIRAVLKEHKLKGEDCASPMCAKKDCGNTFKTCSRCGIPRYCSLECQRSHWKAREAGHKEGCPGRKAVPYRHSRPAFPLDGRININYVLW